MADRTRRNGEGTIRGTTSVLSQNHTEAIRHELVVSNPVGSIRIPRFERIHGPIVIGLTTGLCLGEIRHLRWEGEFRSKK